MKALFNIGLQNWLSFEVIVKHKKGIENVKADVLSRSDHLDEPTKEENKKYQAYN